MRNLSANPLPRDGHDTDCASLWFEPCDCVQGIIREVATGFREDLKRIFATPTKDTPDEQ